MSCSVVPNDAATFVKDDRAPASGKTFSEVGTYADDGVILQDPAHIDVLWTDGNAVVRVKMAGNEKYSKEAAVTDAKVVADLGAANAAKS